jgi:hypothetical protein
LIIDGRLHKDGHAKGRYNKRCSPKLWESSTDEVTIEEGALGVLAAHGQTE